MGSATQKQPGGCKCFLPQAVPARDCGITCSSQTKAYLATGESANKITGHCNNGGRRRKASVASEGQQLGNALDKSLVAVITTLPDIQPAATVKLLSLAVVQCFIASLQPNPIALMVCWRRRLQLRERIDMRRRQHPALICIIVFLWSEVLLKPLAGQHSRVDQKCLALIFFRQPGCIIATQRTAHQHDRSITLLHPGFQTFNSRQRIIGQVRHQQPVSWKPGALPASTQLLCLERQRRTVKAMQVQNKRQLIRFSHHCLVSSSRVINFMVKPLQPGYGGVNTTIRMQAQPAIAGQAPVQRKILAAWHKLDTGGRGGQQTNTITQPVHLLMNVPPQHTTNRCVAVYDSKKLICVTQSDMIQPVTAHGYRVMVQANHDVPPSCCSKSRLKQIKLILLQVSMHRIMYRRVQQHKAPPGHIYNGL